MNKLESKEGMYLTQKEDTSDRIFVTSIIGITATYEYWREATEEEKVSYEGKQANENKTLKFEE